MIGDKTLWNLYILYLDNHGIKTNVGLILIFALTVARIIM